MEIKLYDNEKEALAQFLCATKWTYHANEVIEYNKILKAIESGYYEDEKETHWIMFDGAKVGILVIEDINDTIPLFDIRLSEQARGKNIGTQALIWLQDYLFGEKQKIRIEAYTRADNIAMRKAFTKAGFVKEGYLRSAWENNDGTISDTVVYGAILSDWLEQKMTPIQLDKVSY